MKVHKIPPVVLKAVIDAPSKDLNEIERVFMSIPKELRAALLPYQIEGVLFGLQQGGRAIIGDEMVGTLWAFRCLLLAKAQTNLLRYVMRHEITHIMSAKQVCV